MARKQNITWLISGKTPTKKQVTNLKNYAQSMITREIYKGAKNYKVNEMIKEFKKIDRLTNKNVRKSTRSSIFNFFSNQDINKQGKDIFLKGFREKTTSQEKNYIKSRTIKKLEKVLKIGKSKNSVLNYVKSNNQEFINTKILSGIGQKQAKKQLEEETSGEDDFYNNLTNEELLELLALNHDIIGPILENMGGWAVANAKYSADLERILNNYGSNKMLEIKQQIDKQK